MNNVIVGDTHFPSLRFLNSWRSMSLWEKEKTLQPCFLIKTPVAFATLTVPLQNWRIIGYCSAAFESITLIGLMEILELKVIFRLWKNYSIILMLVCVSRWCRQYFWTSNQSWCNSNFIVVYSNMQFVTFFHNHRTKDEITCSSVVLCDVEMELMGLPSFLLFL